MVDSAVIQFKETENGPEVADTPEVDDPDPRSHSHCHQDSRRNDYRRRRG